MLEPCPCARRSWRPARVAAPTTWLPRGRWRLWRCSPSTPLPCCTTAASSSRGRARPTRTRSSPATRPPRSSGSVEKRSAMCGLSREPSTSTCTSTRRLDRPRTTSLVGLERQRSAPSLSRGKRFEAEPSLERNPSDRPCRYLRHPMGTVYAIANQKGGVGKTTTAVNTAACVAEAGYPTLLVDLDPQCNATVALGLPKDCDPTIYDCLLSEDGLTLEDVAREAPGIERLSIVPSTPDLAGAGVELPRMPGSEMRLRESLGSVRENYLFTLFDCPPSLGPLTVNALVAADRVIVPVQTEYFALEGLAGLLDTLSLIQRELNPRLTVAGMILTMHDGRTRLAQEVEREVREHFPELVFDTVIPRNVRLGEAPTFGFPIPRHAPASAGSAAYIKLAREVAARV